MKKVVIIGAGPAGLTAAYELLKKNKEYKIIILEESNIIGGISKTINYKGNRMDIGGHRFFSKDHKVNDFWETIMPLQGKKAYDDKILNTNKDLKENGPDPEKEDRVMLVRNRVSRIYYLKKFFDYPVSMKLETIKNMGFKNTIKSGFSYFKSLIFKKKEDNLENFYINRFGKQLYSMFFEKYTEKLWGRHPKEISADWGSQRVKGLSILGVVKDLLKLNKTKETSLIEEYKYPKYGPGELWEEVANQVKMLGGTILLNQKVINIKQKNKKIISVATKDNEYSADIFISSMPIKDLITSMNDVPKNINMIATGLPYRDFITVGVLVKKLKIKNQTKIKTLGNIVPDCWIYVQEPDVKMGRIQIFNNWSPYMVKDIKNTIWIGLEYFCNENDELWNMSEKEFTTLATNELVKIGIIDAEDIIDTHEEKVKKAYPAYFDTYKDIDKVIDYLNDIDNLYCIGRNGQHRYNNMDHSMVTAFEATDNIISNKKDKQNIWNVNTEQEYHEESKQNNNSNKNKLKNIIFVLFSLISLIITINHEPWRDEAQNYLLSRLNIIELFNQLKVEGHPIVWYLVLKITNLTYESMWILPWIITLISAFLIIYKMDKPIINKLFILLSVPIIYVSSAFTRSYSLAILFVVLIATVYKERYNYPVIYGILLALLLNTHIIFAGFVGSLVLIDIYNLIKEKTKRKNKVKILIIFIIGLLLLFLTLFNSVGARNDLFDKETFSHLNYLNPLIKMTSSITGNLWLRSIFISFLVYLIWYLILEKKKGLLITFLLSLITFVVIMAIYSGNYYMHTMLLVIILFIYWQGDNKKGFNLLIGILFLVTLYQTYIITIPDVKYYYSTSKITSEYIKYNINSEEKIYCLDTSICMSMVPYIPQYNFIDIRNNQSFTYVDWIKNIHEKKDIIVFKLNDEQKTSIKYLIIPQMYKSIYDKDYKVIYISPPCSIENYIIMEKK